MIPGGTPMVPYELFRRLKPLYPAAIARLWIEYQTATPEAKRDIDELLTILAIKRLGMMIGDEQLVLDAPPPALIGRGDFTIGHVTYPGIPPYPFRVKRNELLRHIFILGPTGTGKSTLLLHLLTQLLAARVPFMIFDFKRNYRCLLHAPSSNDVIVFTVGRKTAPLAINVLQAPPGVEFTEWADALTDTIGTSHLLLQGAKNVLKEALLQAHEKHHAQATLAHAHALLQATLYATRQGSRKYGWLESATRSIEELTKGAFGQALNATNGSALNDLLQHAVIFELHGFGDDQKRFFCLYFLHAILQLRKNSTTAREQLQHVLVFDEGHNVFPRERLGEISIPARLAREVREYGEAIIAATQQADISESLIANSGFKLILRCDYPKDVTFASQLLQIKPEWLPRLALGTGIARLPVRCYNPILFTFPEQPIKNTTTTDDDVHAQWTRFGLPTSESKSATPESLSEREEQLLRDVATEPISPITHRYQRLGWHTETGNRTKDAIIKKGLVHFEPVSTPKGQVKILTLTDTGADFLRSKGIDLTRRRHGGAAHEYWKHELRTQLGQHGYTVNEEYSLGAGKTADLRASKDPHVLFIEIETGRSDIAATVAKYPPDKELVVFFTSDEIAARYRDLITLGRPGTRCITPTTMNELAP